MAVPFVGIAPSVDGRGYWVANGFGDVDHFGDAPNEGVLANRPDAPIAGIASSPVQPGYWLVGADGGVFSFGDATFHGSLGAVPLGSETPVVAIAAPSRANGYLLATTDKQLPPSARGTLGDRRPECEV